MKEQSAKYNLDIDNHNIMFAAVTPDGSIKGVSNSFHLFFNRTSEDYSTSNIFEFFPQNQFDVLEKYLWELANGKYNSPIKIRLENKIIGSIDFILYGEVIADSRNQYFKEIVLILKAATGSDHEKECKKLKNNFFITVTTNDNIEYVNKNFSSLHNLKPEIISSASINDFFDFDKSKLGNYLNGFLSIYNNNIVMPMVIEGTPQKCYCYLKKTKFGVKDAILIVGTFVEENVKNNNERKIDKDITLSYYK